jgi:SpoIID/LytB domain protein
MKWKYLLIVTAAVILGLGAGLVTSVMAVADCSQLSGGDKTQCEDWNKQMSELQTMLDTNKGAADKIAAKIKSIQSQFNVAAAKLKVTEANIADRSQKVSTSYLVLSEKVREMYKRMRSESSLAVLVTQTDMGQVQRELAYRQEVNDQDKQTIIGLVQEISQLQTDKKNLEMQKAQLAKLQADLDVQNAAYQKAIKDLSNQIAVLSAKQQAFLAAKLAALNIPLYAISGGGCSSDLTNGKDPGFSGGIGFFTFGVPNRVGLNQYGAWGRAKAGQSAETILRAYYNFDSLSGVDTGKTIRVNGGNGINQGSIIWSGSLEDYVKRVYEVPDTWTDNDNAALKAQAIAVRSYVLAATNNGADSICANQYCQVFKTGAKGGNWESAVNATSGQVMMQGGNPVKAYFSSTHGGYVYSTADLSGWSATAFTKRAVDMPNGSASSISDLRDHAYDHESPWFYCDWGSRSGYGNTAWLKPEEVADIVNVLLLEKRDSSSQPHLAQLDKPNPDGTDTWSADIVKSKLGGDAYTAVDSISVNVDFGIGKTTQVTVSGSGHTDSFSGDEFKTYFNLRAPGNIQIVGPLFNVERR